MEYFALLSEEGLVLLKRVIICNEVKRERVEARTFS